MSIKLLHDPIMGTKLLHESLAVSRLVNFTVSSPSIQNDSKKKPVQRIRSNPNNRFGKRV